MLSLLDPPAPHVVAVQIVGTFGAAATAAALAALRDVLARQPLVSIYIDADGWDGLSLAAVVADLRHGVPLAGRLHRFRRLAVISGRSWLTSVVEAERAMLPGIELRVFSPSARTEAMDWVGEPPIRRPESPAPSAATAGPPPGARTATTDE